jgi:hypothetical protein
MGSLVVRKRDGTSLGDIYTYAFDKQGRRRLSRPSSCTFRIPSSIAGETQDDGRPLICAGYRQIEFNLDSMGLFHHGLCWIVEDEGDEDIAYTRVTSYDPMRVWPYRPARDGVASPGHTVGDFSDPQFIVRNQTGPQIMEEILLASENPAEIPDDAEGQLFLDLAASTYATGGADLRGAPTDFPMSIAEVATLLTNSGELDIYIEPVVGGIGAEGFQNMGIVHCYNGDFGTDRTSSVHFDYGIEADADNISRFRRSEDMSSIATKLWYFLGQRMDQQHWRANVTADHPDLITAAFNPPGGRVYPVVGPLGNLIWTSRSEIGVFMLINVYDNFGSEDSAYPLFVRQWQVESLLRAKPREMLYITPVRKSQFTTVPAGMDIFLPGDFDVGDLVTVNMGQKSRMTESGGMRIYGYTVDVDDDDVETLGEFETSPDQDSI